MNANLARRRDIPTLHARYCRLAIVCAIMKMCSTGWLKPGMFVCFFPTRYHFVFFQVVLHVPPSLLVAVWRGSCLRYTSLDKAMSAWGSATDCTLSD
ncbi:hypothetical protein F5Y10DRAFT_192445 [Nemania abortiva]|nr:hypothetical protein F5Y10DRAFT_192445 [Nemania abortiva]